VRNAEREGIVLQRDSASHTLRGTSGNGNSAIWVSDAILLEELIRGAEQLGVRRFAFWRLGQEDPAVWARLRDGKGAGKALEQR
jgi:spore germination protein YaaH